MPWSMLENTWKHGYTQAFENQDCHPPQNKIILTIKRFKRNIGELCALLLREEHAPAADTVGLQTWSCAFTHMEAAKPFLMLHREKRSTGSGKSSRYTLVVSSSSEASAISHCQK